jgi:hypothetical protein
MKQTKLKNQKYESEDIKEAKSLIIITIVIVLLAIGLYFLTSKILNKKASTTDSDVEFDYSVCTVGTLFNRPYTEYYVFLYDSTSDDAIQYQSLTSSYEAKDEAIKIYTVDLSANLDQKYLSETSNHKPANPSEVQINSSALILIKDGKVSKYYENISDYEKVLN